MSNSLTRFEVSMHAPVLGKVKHVIKAQNRAAAIAKAKRAHPGAVNVSAQEMGNPPGLVVISMFRKAPTWTRKVAA